MQSIFERMGGTYRPEGDYYVPNIPLSDTSGHSLGKYGRIRRRCLKEYRPSIYSRLVTSGKLFDRPAEIDQTCHERMERIRSDMAKRESMTEALKTTGQMERVRRMNGIRNRAEEIVLSKLTNYKKSSL